MEESQIDLGIHSRRHAFNPVLKPIKEDTVYPQDSMNQPPILLKSSSDIKYLNPTQAFVCSRQSNPASIGLRDLPYLFEAGYVNNICVFNFNEIHQSGLNDPISNYLCNIAKMDKSMCE